MHINFVQTKSNSYVFKSWGPQGKAYFDYTLHAKVDAVYQQSLQVLSSVTSLYVDLDGQKVPYHCHPIFKSKSAFKIFSYDEYNNLSAKAALDILQNHHIVVYNSPLTLPVKFDIDGLSKLTYAYNILDVQGEYFR